MNNDQARSKVLMVLTRHVGANRAISMGELYRQVYNKDFANKINDTRNLRILVTQLRKEGVPILSVSDKEGGGYYLASAGSELEGYCKRLRSMALKKLAQEARMRNIGLPALLGQIVLNLEGAS